MLASAGLGSRRQCEELITSGRVEIDGQVVTQLGTRVDPRQHEITVDGEPVARSRPVYYMVNKPQGALSTNRDPQGRLRVIDLIPPGNERLFTVGRLDQASEGLMLVTNDGELANRLTHPRFGVHKTYHVLVAGQPGPEIVEQLRRGIHSSDGVLRARQVRVRRSWKKSTILEMVLDEGRNREIRRMMAGVGHKVMRLRRVALGPLRLGELPIGQHRRLTPEELAQLRQLARLAPASRGKKRSGKPKRSPQATGAPKSSSRPTAQPPRKRPASRTVLGDEPATRQKSRRRPPAS